MPGWNPSQWDEFIDTAVVLAPPVDLAPPVIEQPAPMGLVDPFAGAPVPTDAPAPAAPAETAAPAPSPGQTAAPAAPAATAGPDIVPPPLPEQPAIVDTLPSFEPPPPYTAPERPDFTIAQENDLGGMTPTDPDRMSPERLGVHLSSLPTEQQEMERSKIEGARQKFESARRLDLAEKALKDAEDNARIRQEATKAAQQRMLESDAEARKLAAENPLDSISGTRKVLGVLASIVGGFMVNKTGRNMGLEAVDQIANEAAALHSQKLQLNARQRQQAGDDIDRADAAFRAGEVARLAVYDGAQRALEAEIQNFDPRGTAALRIMDNINAIRARRAELLQKGAIEDQKRVETALKLQLDASKLAEDQRHNLAGEKADATRAYADLLNAKTAKAKAETESEANTQLTADELRARGVNIPAGVDVPPMSLGQAKKLAETAKSVEDWQKAARENSPEERNRELAIGEIVDDQGNPIKFRNPDFAGKLANSKAAVDNAARLVDKIILARQKYGWSSDLLKSPEWREMQADYTALQLEKKTTDELGVLAGPDMGLIEKSLGTKDPTELRDPTPGLKTARSNMVEQLNAKVRAQAVLPEGRSAKRYEPPDMTRVAAPVQTAGEDTVKTLINFDPKKPSLAESREMGGVGKQMAGDAQLPPTYADAIDRLAATFNNPNAEQKDRDQAGAFLDQLINRAGSSLVREYAQRAAAAAATAVRPSPEEPGLQ